VQHVILKRLANALAIAALLGATACQQAAAPPPTTAPAAGAQPTEAPKPAATTAPAAPKPTEAPKPAVTTAPAGPAPTTAAAAGAATGEPLKIGILLSTTGPFAFEGQGGNEGIRLYWDQEGNRVGNRPVQLISEDTAGVPEQALTKARKLVEQDKVHMLIGPVGSNEGLAIRNYIHEQKIPTIFGYAISKALTQDQASPYIFRSTGSLQLSAAGGWFAAKKLNYKRAIVVAADYAAGHDAADYFKQYFEGAGGKVAQEIFVPLNATDVAPYITQIQGMAGQADAVVLPQIVGVTAINFVKSYNDFGLKNQFPLFVSAVTVDEGSTLPEEGQAALGIQSYGDWAITLDRPENKKFIDDFKAKYNKEPGQHHMYSYVSMKTFGEALKKVNANTDDKDALIDAISKVEWEAPNGRLRFDEKHQAIITVYLRKVERQGDRLVNVVSDRVDGVDQFWKAPS
jgi:branched-chain amino acid transport system substrate-binding protein